MGSTSSPSIPSDEGGKFTFTGTGSNFSGTNDRFFFASRSVSNSIEFIARLWKISQATNLCQCGIMLRESNDPGSPFLFLGVSGANVFCTKRPSRGSTCIPVNGFPGVVPVFFRLRRIGEIVIADFSTDGNQWSHGMTNQISMASSGYFVGFAVTSGNPSLVVNAEFDSITNLPAGVSP